MKKIIGFVLVLSFLFPSYAISAPMKPCPVSKIGLINKQNEKCVKRGIFYRWVKVKTPVINKSTIIISPVAKETPTVVVQVPATIGEPKQETTIIPVVETATVVETVTVVVEKVEPTVVVKKTTSQLARDSFVAWANKNESKKDNHFINKSPDVNNDVFVQISATEIKAANIFANFVKNNTYGYYGGEDKSWFFRQGKLVPPNNNVDVCRIDNGGINACVNLIDSAFYKIPNGSYAGNNQVSALGAHEYFHLAQASLSGISPFSPRSIPEWFMEGSSEFVGYAVVSMIENKDYDLLLMPHLKEFRDLSSDPYISGRIFIEFIVKEYGFEKIIAIFSDYKDNKNFDQIFKNNIGLSVNDVLNNCKIGL